MTGLFLFGALFLMGIVGPGYKFGAIHAWRRSCYVNLRVLSSAVEMHLMGGAPLASVVASDDTIILSAALRPKSATEPPTCMCGGTYKMGGTGSDTYVYCTFHGDTEEGGPVPGSLDPGYSQLWWLSRFLRDLFRW